MRFLVLLNPASGAAAATEGDVERQVGSLFRQCGADAKLISGAPPELIDRARRAATEGFDAVIAGGGDGTLNAIANVLAGSSLAFGVLPLGTHNHFAKELAVPLELDQAVRALSAGRLADLDVAEVNGRVFLNFSGIGLHPQIVMDRDANQDVVKEAGRFGHVVRKAVKVVAGLAAFGRSLARIPGLGVRLTSGNRVRRRLASSVIVCTNVHQMDVFGTLNVSHPSRQKLNVYVATTSGPIGVIRLLTRAVLRRLDGAKSSEFESFSAPALRIDLRRHRLPVSIDGEVEQMQPPLRYTIRRGGLKVIVP